MNKIIGIVGSRRRSTKVDFDLVKAAFEKIYEKGDSVVSGGCPRGADRFAEIICWDCELPLMRTFAEELDPYTFPQMRIYTANWNKYGRIAGFHRNTFIARDSDILIACVAPDRTGGTEDTIKKFLKKSDKLILV